ncbi:MAG: hypothetical protein AAFX05_02480 [Planctomycetota bacterium]
MSKTSKTRKSSRSTDDGPSIRERLGDAGVMLGRAAGGIIVVVLLVAWMLSVGPLQERVGLVRALPVSAEMHWPPITAAAPGGEAETWIPIEMQRALTQLVEQTVSPDPFDAASLEQARMMLESTGWFTQLDAVTRDVGGVVHVEGSWRVPAAVVVKHGAEHLVGLDGAPMRLPDGMRPPTALFRIINPQADVPQDPDSGETRYGVPWHFDDVHMGIALLERVAGLPESTALIGVDLSDYPQTGRLVLVSDASCRLVWGAPLDQPVPGETGIERKIAHLRTILDPRRRLDRAQRRIELFTDHVFIDRTPEATPSP